MAALIDASILIAVERGPLSPGVLLQRRAQESVALAAVTAAELLHGVHGAQTASQRLRRQQFVGGLLAALPTLAFGLAAAGVHAALWAVLVQACIADGERDLLIAATAIAFDHSVITRDQRSFPRIPGLRVERV